MAARFPDGRRFAFTIIDDTDVATVRNVEPVYRLLDRLGMRTTKTVWPLACPEGSSDYAESQTLEDPEYRAFVLDLSRRGFEIASHGATMESSERDRTVRGLETLRETFGSHPAVHANHANNRESLYWGTARLDDPIVRAVYRRILGDRDRFEGHIPGSAWWWGDIAQAHIRYARNLTFNALDTSSINPTLPYRDPHRPLVPWWFSASDAEDCEAFNRLLRPSAQERLERHGGIAIVATHFGKGFVADGCVDQDTTRLLEALSRRAGWFVPLGELLDWLRQHGAGGALPSGEWRRMQWRWLRDLLARGSTDAWQKMVRRQSGRTR